MSFKLWWEQDEANRICAATDSRRAIGPVPSTPVGPKPAKKARVVPVVEVIAALGEGLTGGSIAGDPIPGDLVSVPVHLFGFDAKDELEWPIDDDEELIATVLSVDAAQSIVELEVEGISQHVRLAFSVIQTLYHVRPARIARCEHFFAFCFVSTTARSFNPGTIPSCADSTSAWRARSSTARATPLRPRSDPS